MRKEKLENHLDVDSDARRRARAFILKDLWQTFADGAGSALELLGALWPLAILLPFLGMLGWSTSTFGF
ncbi:hypothetical protein [Paraburkholderia sp. SIMBA_054]|uniref:hypothetical protein n=1 Tax=Paraburkholderia sp. SIMBA_054 TaxID=3085795 RepID=UPI00397E4B8C